MKPKNNRLLILVLLASQVIGGGAWNPIEAVVDFLGTAFGTAWDFINDILPPFLAAETTECHGSPAVVVVEPTTNATRLYGAGTCPVSIVARSPNHLDAFATGLDGHVYAAGWAGSNVGSSDPEPKTNWTGWSRIDGIQVTPCAPISAISRSEGKLDIFTVDIDGYVRTAAWEEGDTEWRGWRSVLDMKTTLHAPVTVVSRAQDWMDIFLADVNGAVFTAAWHPTFSDGWHGWWRIGDAVVPPGAPIGGTARSPDNLDIFVVDNDGNVSSAAWEPNAGWKGWWNILGLNTSPRTPVNAASRLPNILDIFTTDRDGNVVSAAWQPTSSDGWLGWWVIGENFSAKKQAPVTAVSRSDGLLDIFAVNGDDGRVFTAAYATEWIGWFPVDTLNSTAGATVNVVSRYTDYLDVIACDANGEVYTAAWDPNTTDGQWKGWWQVADLITGVADPKINDWFEAGIAFVSKNTAWSDSAQGMTTDGDAWYYTSNGDKQIHKFSATGDHLVSKELAYGIYENTHVGASGYFDGKVYVAIQGPHSVWSANQDFSNGLHHAFDEERNSFGWTDINPLNGRLYTSEFRSPIALIAYDKETLERRPDDDIPLESDSFLDHIQGGIFTQHGNVLLSRSDPNGVLCFSAITGSYSGAKSLGSYGHFFSETEGLTVRPWKFGSKRADVHILEKDIDLWTDDAYLHSYAVPDPAYV